MPDTAENDAPLPPGAWQHTCMRPGDEATCPGCQARVIPPEVGER